eukprot:792619-Amphidinium_carterae.2
MSTVLHPSFQRQRMQSGGDEVLRTRGEPQQQPSSCCGHVVLCIAHPRGGHFTAPKRRSDRTQSQLCW